MKNLKNQWVTVLITLFPLFGYAQFYTNSAFNISEIRQNGTARFQGVGGNHAALGGDASTTFGNPAGLAFFNRSEVSFSPSLFNVSTNTTYIGNSVTQSKSNPNLFNHFAIVLAGTPQGYNRKWKRTGLGITYSRQNNLTNQFQYIGTNNKSSFVDYVVERVNGDKVPFDQLDQEYNASKNLSQTLDAAVLNLYLFDDTTPTGPPYRRAIPLRNAAVNQDGLYTRGGSTSQWTFGYAGNYDDKLYVGVSLGLWRTTYNYSHTLNERFSNAKPFTSFTYNEKLNMTGSGINVSVGAMYKATDNIQIGGYIASPSLSTLHTIFDENVGVSTSGDIPVYGFDGKPVTNTQGLQLFTKLAQPQIPVETFDFSYSLTGPLRASGGITYFLGGGKYGFITATADYVGYKGMRMSTDFYSNQSDNTAFRTDMKTQVQRTFNSTVNFRIGAEGRLGNFRVRAGGAYLPDAYTTRIDNLDRSRLQLSAGLGYRNEKFFVDLAGTYLQSKDAYTPYKLNDVTRYSSAQINSTGINMIVSTGVFF